MTPMIVHLRALRAAGRVLSPEPPAPPRAGPLIGQVLGSWLPATITRSRTRTGKAGPRARVVRNCGPPRKLRRFLGIFGSESMLTARARSSPAGAPFGHFDVVAGSLLGHPPTAADPDAHRERQVRRSNPPSPARARHGHNFLRCTQPRRSRPRGANSIFRLVRTGPCVSPASIKQMLLRPRSSPTIPATTARSQSALVPLRAAGWPCRPIALVAVALRGFRDRGA